METVKRPVIERGLQEEREGMNRHNIGVIRAVKILCISQTHVMTHFSKPIKCTAPIASMQKCKLVSVRL